MIEKTIARSASRPKSKNKRILIEFEADPT